MKRSPLKRSTPLRRKAWMKQRSDTKYRRRPRDGAYMGWIRWQSCCARTFATTPCYGNVEADHAGRRGIGQKADDRTCIPLCRNHHRERTDFSGAFKGWTQNGMRVWLNIMIAKHQDRYDEKLSSGNQRARPMRRNRAPAVTLTDEQRRSLDDAVLGYVRRNEERAGLIVGANAVQRVIETLPRAKSDYRYVGEALQRLKSAGKIELVRGRWRTTSPTS